MVFGESKYLNQANHLSVFRKKKVRNHYKSQQVSHLIKSLKLTGKMELYMLKIHLSHLQNVIAIC